MNQKLIDIIQKKHAKSSGLPIDWDKRKNDYLKAVEDLYLKIENIFSTSIEQKLVSLNLCLKELNETYIGTYKIDDLILIIGDEQVRFSPRGRNIVGSFGRVDVIGEFGEQSLILQEDTMWHFVLFRQPTLKTVPFDELSLTTILENVMSK